MKSIADIMPNVIARAHVANVKPTRYRCELCNDTGIVYRVTEDDGILQLYGQTFCECIEGKRLRYVGVPDIALDWTWDGCPKERDTVRKLAETGEWALLMGPVGTGKTGLVVCAYKDKRDNGASGRFYNMAVMFDEAKHSFHADTLNPMERYQNRGAFLVLDGLGERPITEWEQGAVAQLIGQRYSHGLQTFLTTNWGLEDIHKHLGAWVVDRVRDAGGVVALAGKSMRGR